MANAPRKVAQEIFRVWCAENGVVVDVIVAADLVVRIQRAIESERVAPFTSETSSADYPKVERITDPVVINWPALSVSTDGV